MFLGSKSITNNNLEFLVTLKVLLEASDTEQRQEVSDRTESLRIVILQVGQLLDKESIHTFNSTHMLINSGTLRKGNSSVH